MRVNKLTEFRSLIFHVLLHAYDALIGGISQKFRFNINLCSWFSRLYLRSWLRLGFLGMCEKSYFDSYKYDGYTDEQNVNDFHEYGARICPREPWSRALGCMILELSSQKSLTRTNTGRRMLIINTFLH